MPLTPEEQEQITKDAILKIDYSEESAEKRKYYEAIRNDMETAKEVVQERGMKGVTFEL
tara:strand:+ start:555 stop:731 length:177 start_codon:yes stop_codon:yes gene_type:complete